MLVVHPQDRTTDVLQLLYEGLEANDGAILAQHFHKRSHHAAWSW